MSNPVHPGHPYVQQDYVDRGDLEYGNGLLAALGLADYCQVLLLLQHPSQPFADHVVVVDQEDSNLTHTFTCIPWRSGSALDAAGRGASSVGVSCDSV